MRKLRITHDCLVNGQHTPQGTESDFDVGTAQRLLDAGVAVEIKSDKIENREASAESRDPQPAEKPGTPKA